jgi:hypothetical protein
MNVLASAIVSKTSLIVSFFLIVCWFLSILTLAAAEMLHKDRCSFWGAQRNIDQKRFFANEMREIPGELRCFARNDVVRCPLTVDGFASLAMTLPVVR